MRIEAEDDGKRRDKQNRAEDEFRIARPPVTSGSIWAYVDEEIQVLVPQQKKKEKDKEKEGEDTIPVIPECTYTTDDIVSMFAQEARPQQLTEQFEKTKNFFRYRRRTKPTPW